MNQKPFPWTAPVPHRWGATSDARPAWGAVEIALLRHAVLAAVAGGLLRRSGATARGTRWWLVLPLLLVALPYGFCLAGLRLHIGASRPLAAVHGLDGWMQVHSPGKAPDRSGTACSPCTCATACSC